MQENTALPIFHNVFRSIAWVQAWIDTYGKDPRITLLDPLGRNNPLEIFYQVKSPVKKWLSFQTLALAGTVVAPLSAPRSEYNHMGLPFCDRELFSSLGDFSWSQIVFKDLAEWASRDIELLASKTDWSVHANPCELTYYISAPDINVFKESLSASVRARYFNRRSRLASLGCLEFLQYGIEEADTFLEVLDSFHIQRWGQPCYSNITRCFLKNFMARLVDEGGTVIMEAILLDGKPISVIYDLIYSGRRYSFQSGFAELSESGVSLGSLHMGYAIEAAIRSGQEYDLLAGQGKNRNYKAAIANQQAAIQTVIIEKPHVSLLRGLKKKISALR